MMEGCLQPDISPIGDWAPIMNWPVIHLPPAISTITTTTPTTSPQSRSKSQQPPKKEKQRRLGLAGVLERAASW
ncbi:hypothetical protein IE53DRAFT_367491 [Violaceomyces palustris]|uniref:Uncharacterized protein n=1 Tax=Violaceomyces palustris TaxID=1673888 RepID=A0ACD0P201_9BASI|nr:hypothetical protein IE53DRAFT_367491 [Violaceomyces palustris]